MKSWTFLVLLSLTALMGLVLYFGVQKPAERREARKEAESRLFPGNLSALAEIRLQLPEFQIELERRGQNWWMRKPVSDLASKTKIENLVSAFERSKKVKEILSAEEVKKKPEILSDFMLKDPEISISVKSSEATEPITLRLGRKNPSSSGLYAQTRPDGEVVLTGLDLDYLSTQSVGDFREMRFLTVPSSDVSEYEIQNNSSRIKLSRNEKGDWVMVFPDKDWPVDQEFAKNQIDKITYLRANTFLDKESSALKSPSIKIIVGFKEGISDARSDANDKRPSGAEIHLAKARRAKGKVGDDGEDFDYYAKGDKTNAASIAKFHFENFMKKPEDFVRKTFDDFEVSDVVGMRVMRDNELLADAELNDREWKVSREKKEDEPRSGQKALIEQSLTKLRNLRAVTFAGPYAKVSGKGLLSITLKLKDGSNRKFTFDFGKDQSQLWFEDGRRKLKYLMLKDPVAVKDFSFAYLTEDPKQAAEAQQNTSSQPAQE